MFKKFLLFSLVVCIGMIAFMASEATSGCPAGQTQVCCCNPRYCVCCKPKCLECTAMATGLGNIYNQCTANDDPTDPTTLGDCPVGSLTIFGTVRLQGKKFVEDLAYCSNFDPTNRATWKTDCSIPMIVDCENPDYPAHQPKKPSGVAVPYNYPYPMESGGVAFYCDKNGNCKEDITFEVTDLENLCKFEWWYQGDTILSYIQSGDFCKGGWVCPATGPDGRPVELTQDGTQCCYSADIVDGHCPAEKEVLDGRICCAGPGRVNGRCGTEDNPNLNYGMINDVFWFWGGPTRVFTVCRYTLIDPDPLILGDEFYGYDCKRCEPQFDTSVVPKKVTSWNCPAQ